MKKKLASVAMVGAVFAGAAVTPTAPEAMAHTIELTGNVRDFRMSHPDMERNDFLFWHFSDWNISSGSREHVYPNMVYPHLCSEGLPRLNLHYKYGVFETKTTPSGPPTEMTVYWFAPDTEGQVLANSSYDEQRRAEAGEEDGGVFRDSVWVECSRHLSNVVVGLDDGTEYKFDNLSHEQVNLFKVPEEHVGKRIETVWVKAGPYSSGDGPGYGMRFDREDATWPRPMPVHSVESFNQWYRDKPGTNINIAHTITLDNGQDEPGGIYTFARVLPNSFFPIDHEGFGNEGLNHNFHFTFELRTQFTYTAPEDRDYELVFTFTGDDDVWVFIGGKLAIDLGGVHPQASQTINLDDEAERFGLEPGETYTLDVFMAERHTVQSNFRIDTTLELSEVQPTTVSPLYD